MRRISWIAMLLLAGFGFVSHAQSNPVSSGACGPIVKKATYKMQKGDYPAAVLRKFGLEPVFGRSGSMNALLKINSLKNPDVVEPGAVLTLPFSCEQQVQSFKVISENQESRLLSSEKIVPSMTESVAVSAPIQASDKFTQIVSNPAQEADQQALDVEATSKSQDNISEALRYRMICEGEWTGSECITRYSALFVNLGGYNNRYDGIDASPTPGKPSQGLLLSKLNLAGGFGWNNYWNENVKTVLYAELQNNQMLPDIKNIPIEGGNRLLTSLQAEARYEKGSWGLGLGFRQLDKLYYVFNFDALIQGSFCNANDVSQCGVRVYSASVSSLFFDVSYMIHQAGKFRFDTELKYFTLGATKVSNVDVGSGSGQSIEFSITHDRVAEYLKGTLRYAMSSQDTSIETQNAKELALLFTYSWKLKDWSEAAVAPSDKTSD